MSLASLFLMHVPSNTGYAIAPLETLFYEAGLELAEGDPKQVHFGYSSLEKGLPTSLPQSFTNVIAFDFKQQNPAQIQHLTRHVAEKRIRFVLIFDIQVVDPLFRPLRQAGVATIVTYWGAPISSRMPWWKLALKRLQVGLSRSKVDGLIFESQAMADLAIYGRGVPPDMIDIVPLGVDIKLFSPDRSDYVYTELGLPKERKVIIYVGHMEERKGVRALVEAAIELLVKRRRPQPFCEPDPQRVPRNPLAHGCGLISACGSNRANNRRRRGLKRAPVCPQGSNRRPPLLWEVCPSLVNAGVAVIVGEADSSFGQPRINMLKAGQHGVVKVSIEMGNADPLW